MKITIENKLVSEKRDLSVYHHASKSAHLISQNSSITLPLGPAVEDDYLYVSIVSGPGHLERESVVDLPAWMDFEFLSEGKLMVTHSEDRTLLKIPPGLPEWKLRLTRTSSPFIQTSSRVTISDDPLQDTA